MNMKNNMKKTLVLPLILTLIATATIGTATTLTSNTISNQGSQLELSWETPYEIFEGQNFKIGVFGDNQSDSIEGATVRWLDHDYLTDPTGYVTLTAPMVKSNTFFYFKIMKNGYRTIEDRILVKDGSAPSPLRLIVRPSISRDCEFAVGVYSVDTPIADALVGFSGASAVTGKDGIVEFTAPFVDQDTSFDIRAMKQGYPDAMGSILVTTDLQDLARSTSITKKVTGTVLTAPKADMGSSSSIPVAKDDSRVSSGPVVIPSEQPSLYMKIIPSIQLDEGSTFTTSVTDGKDPVASVLVSFNGQTYITNDEGTATIIAPCVDADTSLYILAQKTGYQENGYYLLIKDTYHPHHEVDLNADYRITIDELTRYAADHGNDGFLQTATDIWQHGEFYNCNLYVCNWSPYHPADTNKDFNIQIEELTAYAAAHGASDPDVQSATYLWQHGESYYWEYSSHNWMPVY